MSQNRHHFAQFIENLANNCDNDQIVRTGYATSEYRYFSARAETWRVDNVLLGGQE